MASGPTKDVKEFQFKISGQLRVFPAGEKLNIDNPVRLVAASSKYGLAFVGTPSGITSIITKTILYSPEIQSKVLTVTSEFPRRSLALASQPSHIDVSADNELLAVAIRIQDIPVLQIYSVPSFASMNVVKKVEMRMSNTGGVKVADLQWNPGVANIITAVMSDGSVVLFEIKDSAFSLNSLPPSTQARCLCWSPKGKQVVIGSADGSLSQYKPDLKQVKTFPPPFQPATIVSVHWPSSFQFIAAYVNMSTPHDRPAIVAVNVPKGGQVSYVRYDDVCFGSLSKRPEYYFLHQQVWNIIVVGCGDSMELSVLGLEPNTTNWVHWKQDDSTRAELPLTQDKDDVHNLGLAFDSSPSQPIQINESVTVGPMPVVLSLSHDGVLVFFTALNFLPTAPAICSPPQPFPDQSGLQLFTTGPPQVGVQKPPQVQPVVSSVAPSQPPVQTSAFPQSTPLFPFAPGSTPSTQTVSPFSQTTSAFPSVPIGGQPSFTSAFASSTQPSLFSTSNTSSFSQQAAPAFGKASMFSSLTPAVSQPASTVLQPSAPAQVAPPTSEPAVSTNPPLLASLTTPSLTPNTKPFLPSTTTSLSFGSLAPQATPTMPVPKPTEAPPKTSISLGGFAFDSSLLSTKNETPQAEVKKATETAAPAVQTPVEKKQPEEKKADTTDIDNAAYMAAVYDELKLFREEYTGVKQYLGSFNVKVADEKTKGELCVKVDSYLVFCTELVETTQAQSAEVSSLKTSLLDIIANIQLIKTKQSISKNQSLVEMKEAEEMDPIGRHWCKKIEQHLYSLQAQVKRAVEQIDSIKNQNNKCTLKLSTFDAILQAIINLSRVINAQKKIISNIETQLNQKVKRFKQRRKQIIQTNYTSRNKIVDDSQLSTLAQKLLQTKLDATEEDSFSYRESSQRMIGKGVHQTNSCDLIKESRLKDWLSKRKINHIKIKQRPQSISDANSPLRPVAKPVEKESVQVEEKVVAPEVPKAKVDVVPGSAVNKLDAKSVQLNRNLFSTTPESPVASGVVPLVPDVKVLFGGATSTPIPVKKDISPIGGISPFQTVSPPDSSIPVVPVSNILMTPKSSVSPFGSVSTPTQVPAATSVKASTVKPLEFQSKSADQGAKVIDFGSAQPVFNFGNTNKEHSSTATLSSSSLFIKPVITTTPLLGSSVPNVEKKSVEDVSVSTAASFTPPDTFLQSATNLKSALTDKAPNETVPPTSTFGTASLSFGDLSIGLKSEAQSASTAPSASVTSTPSIFSFSRSTTTAPVVTVASQTTTVSSVIKPVSTFSFGSVGSLEKPVSTGPSAIPTQPISSFSFSAVPLSEASATVTDSTSVSTVVPVAVVSPAVSTVVSVSSSPNVISTSAPIQVSTPSTKPLAPSIFGGPIVNVSTDSVVTSSESVSSSNVSSATGTTTVATTATLANTTSSVFSTPQAAAENQSFKPPTTSAPTPAFGSPGFGTFTPSTTSSSLFGSSAVKFSTPSTTVTSVFGGLSVSTTASAPIFNQATTTTASPFGQSIASTQAPASPFSQTTPAQAPTPSSPFGQPATTFSSTTPAFGASAFGSGTNFSSLSSPSFRSGSTFGTPTTTPQSVFGGPATTTTASSLFITPLFGQTTAGNSSPFGNVTGQASPFSPATPSTQASTFPFGGTSPANPFLNQSQPTSVFGQASSQGNFGSSGGSMFGGSSSFGASPQAGQFQSSGANIFGGGGGGGPFSSTGNQTVGQTGFGASPSFQSPKPTGAFGSAPVFGSTPSFGGAPAFGSSSSFGSPNKVFGSTSPVAVPQGGAVAGGFGGQQQQQTNMFESLANQNTMSFGNLAQTQQPPTMTPGFGSPQPTQPTAPSFGGNAFSSWR